MKIGILTQPLRSNYGGILQAYALQQTLIRLGYNPIVLNRNFDYPSFRLFLLRCVSVVKCVFRKYALGKRNIRISNPLSTHYTIYKDEYYDNVELRRFTKHHIKRTCVLRSSKLLKLYVRFSRLRCFIVGSDQVWREAYSPCITDYFLHFLPRGKKYKKISYAASFGIKETDISKDKLSLCAKDLKSFDAISVRERTGVDIVNTISGMNAALVLDPTLLLKAEDYSVLIDVQDKKSESGIVCYVLDSDDDKQSIMNDVALSFGQNTTLLSLYPKDDKGNNDKLVSVSKWLSSIANADFVVTDSFHGCVFSVIFKKNFIAIANQDRGVDRFCTLLKSLGLTDRLVFSFDEYLKKKKALLAEVNYCKVEDNLDALRVSSMLFLRESLKSY